MEINSERIGEEVVGLREGNPESKPTTKRAYESPKVLYRAPLEAMAGTCTGYGSKASGAPTCSTTQS